MPAWHSTHSAPAAPTLLRAETPWVLWRGPETPCTLGEGGRGAGSLPGASPLQGLPHSGLRCPGIAMSHQCRRMPKS